MARKSYTKRIKITKTGKLLRRKQGLGHNKAKLTGGATRQKRNLRSISGADRSKVTSRLI
ncbi:MAG: 50S ribosomal protein L35 [Candidatus Colwellbacteria bacterium]|nr:50S ribosomal protein L35 [Candidatus Colwellbacteria bacterium]